MFHSKRKKKVLFYTLSTYMHLSDFKINKNSLLVQKSRGMQKKRKRPFNDFSLCSSWIIFFYPMDTVRTETFFFTKTPCLKGRIEKKCDKALSLNKKQPLWQNTFDSIVNEPRYKNFKRKKKKNLKELLLYSLFQLIIKEPGIRRSMNI